MESERRAFIRAICEAPDDDAPRLIFTDWLYEHEEFELAEFIHVQCEFSRNPEKRERFECDLCFGRDYGKCGRCNNTGFYFRHPLEYRMRDLWYKNYRIWNPSGIGGAIVSRWMTTFGGAGLTKDIGASTVGVILQRGFVNYIACPAAYCPTHLDAILSEHPIREVKLTSQPEPWHEWMDIRGHVTERWPDGQTKAFRLRRWPGVTFNIY